MDSDNPLLSSYQEIMKLMSSSTKIDINECRRAEGIDEKSCNKCEILNQMLRLARLRYGRLQSENFAGQLTISSLKNKNKSLMKKLISNRDCLSTKQSSECFLDQYFQKERQEFIEGQNTYKRNMIENFIDTFNPKQLRKILSDKTMDIITNGNQNHKQIGHQMLVKSQSHPLNRLQQKQNYPQAGKNQKKHFKLSEFKEKNCLNGKQQKISNRPLKSKPVTTEFEFYRF